MKKKTWQIISGRSLALKYGFTHSKNINWAPSMHRHNPTAGYSEVIWTLCPKGAYRLSGKKKHK